MATAAAEVPGKGSVDGKVQEVTESSGPGQPKSLDGLPSAYNSHDFRQRIVSKGKSKLGQVVSEVNLDSSKAGDLASKKAAEKPENAGVDSDQGGPGRSLLEVTVDEEDAVNPANSSHQVLGYTRIGSQDDEIDDNSNPHRLHHIRKSARDTGGTTDTDNSNPSQEYAERSCKSKTAEWALLITSVVLEATSAIFEQLGYPLTSMVMAFVALFLSILDLILKARERGITCDGRGLLPCCDPQSSHGVPNRKRFASLVHYLGLAGALWQCSFTTVGYHYTHHKLANPIKLCLLPFILALCVLISKVVKSSQHES